MAAVLPNQAPNAAMSGLARALVQAGRLTAPQADALNKQAASEKVPFIDVLLDSTGDMRDDLNRLAGVFAVAFVLNDLAVDLAVHE